MPDAPTSADAAAELLRRRKARETLDEYVGYVSGKLAPLHLRMLSADTQKAMNRVPGHDRTAVAFPPGHAKSTYLSHHLPAFYLSKFPDHCIIAATHTQDLAKANGRRARNIMASDEHKNLFPDVMVSEDSAAADAWETTKGGIYLGFGVGSTVVGRRADCLVGSTILHTTNGPCRIDNIDISTTPCYTLSYDTARKDAPSPSYRRVVAVARRKAQERYIIRTASGRVVEATGNHRIYTSRGFVETSTLSVGDVLLRSVWQEFGEAVGRGREEGQKGQYRVLLQPELRDEGEQRGARDGDSENVQGLRHRTVPSGRQKESRMLARVSFDTLQEKRSETQNAAGGLRAHLRNLPQEFLGQKPEAQGPFLQHDLQEYRPPERYVRQKEPVLSAWARIKAWLYARLDGAEESDCSPGRSEMCGVQSPSRPCTYGLPSHKHGPKRSPSGERGIALQTVSPAATRCGSFFAQSDVVSVVERVCGDCDVYDVEVEGTHCFFANDILVHNCIIIDDPLKGMEDADSELIRDKLWTWYGADLYTRLKPGGIIIVIATRYHLDDLTGRLLAASQQPGGEKWHTIIYPALAEKNDPLGRAEGDALWPEWMDKDALLRIKSQPAMTPRMWSALFQQNPVIEGGNLVKRNWVRLWRQPEPPETNFIIQSWDTAVTGKSTSAYSACLTVGVFTDTDGAPSMILLSRWRGRVEYPDLRKMAVRLYHNFLDDRFDMPMHSPSKRSPDVCLVEDKATGRPLINDLSRAGIFATPFAVQRYGDKTARLRLCLDILEAGRLYVPGQPPNYTVPRRWADEFVQSLINFPNADSRDDVDAFSQLVIRLKTSGWVHHSSEGPKEPDYRSEQNNRGAIY